MAKAASVTRDLVSRLWSPEDELEGRKVLKEEAVARYK